MVAGLAMGSTVRAEEGAATKISAEEFLARVASISSEPRPPRGRGRRGRRERARGRPLVKPLAGLRPRGGLRRQAAGSPRTTCASSCRSRLSGRRGLRVKGRSSVVEAARAARPADRADAALRCAGHLLERGDGPPDASSSSGTSASASAASSRRALADQTAGDTSGYDLDRLELEVESLEDLIAEADTGARGVAAAGSACSSGAPGHAPRGERCAGPARSAAAARGLVQRGPRRPCRLPGCPSPGRAGRARGHGRPAWMGAGASCSRAASRAPPSTASQTAWGYLAGLVGQRAGLRSRPGRSGPGPGAPAAGPGRAAPHRGAGDERGD